MTGNPEQWTASERWAARAWALGVGVVTFIAFAPCLDNGFVDWDDPGNFLNNAEYRGLGPQQLRWMFTTFHWGHYQPLYWVTFGADYLIAKTLVGDGLDARVYHATSLFLHVLNSMLVFALAGCVLSLVRPRPPVWVFCLSSAAAALFFSLHPLRVEPVAWATGRGDVLGCFFLLLAVLSYLRAQLAHTAYRGWLATAVGCYALSLLSRSMGVTLPLVLLLVDAAVLRRLGGTRGWWTPAARRVWLEKLPFVALATIFAMVAPIAKSSTASTMTLQSLGLGERLLLACHGLVFYVQKTLWPSGLSPIYELRLPLDISQAKYWAAAVTVLVSLVVLIALRGRLPLTVAGVACYAILLTPVLGLAQAGQQETADRYSYLPAIPLAILFGAGLARVAGWGRRALLLSAGVAGLLLALLGVATWRQCDVWKDTAALWSHAARVSPDSSLAQNSYGYVLLQAGDVQAAEARFRRAIEILPTHETAYLNLWEVLGRRNDTPALMASYQTALLANPRFAAAHFNLANALMRADKPAEALEHYRAALDIKPGDAKAHCGIAVAYRELHDLQSAIRHNRRALELEPGYRLARLNLAIVLRQDGQRAAALDELKAVLRDDPGNATAQRLQARWAEEQR